MSPVLGNDIGPKVAEALGIDATDLRSLQISITAREVVIVTAEYMPRDEQLDDVIEILKRYELVEKVDLPEWDGTFPRCESLSSTKRRRCDLMPGHEGMHESTNPRGELFKWPQEAGI